MIRIALLVICATIVPSVKMWTQTGPYFPLPVRRSGIVPLNDHNAILYPPYMEALENFTTVTGELRMHLFGLLTTDMPPIYNGTLRNIMAVVDGLINTMATRDGSTRYDLVYEAEAPKLYKSALENSGIAYDRLKCVLDDLDNSIYRLKDVANNIKVINLCHKKLVQCDEVINAIINSDDSGKLSKESELLLALGIYTGLYRDNYEELMREKILASPWEGYTFIITSKDLLKPLIESGAEIRRLLQGDNCASHILPRVPINNIGIPNNLDLSEPQIFLGPRRWI